MLPALMTRPHVRKLLSVLLVPAALVVAGCSEEGIDVAANDPLRQGAEIFNDRCAGCHTFDAAGAEGSTTNVGSSEYKDGPNFNQRREDYEDVLFAIQNGGFSSGPMPQNIAVGREAQMVACFVAEYSGRDAEQTVEPGTGQVPPTGSGADDCKQELAQQP
jgi:hypothetical protein